MNKNNNTQMQASSLVKFNFNNKDYLVYFIDENKENKQIFVSRLILNSEGKYFIDNIMPEEKAKLSEIVYNIVILIPTNNQKGEPADKLLSSLTEKYTLSLSNDVPTLGEQEYYNNCSIAITSKELVALAEVFYNTNLKVEEPVLKTSEVPTWEIPSSNEVVQPVEQAVSTVPIFTSAENENTLSPEVKAKEPMVNETPVVEPIPPVVNNNSQATNVIPNTTEEMPANTLNNNLANNSINNNVNNILPENNMPNPQASEIKRKLVEDYGIPAHEIRFIQECKTERSRKAVIEAMNNGDVRVLFGSTSMLGTGVNAQRRAVAVHELECPWRPSDLEQREGRAIRAGNEIAKLYADNKVDVIIYAVEKSLDSYKFNLLHCKATFISQLKRGALGARTIDEGAMDEQNGMNFSEYMAILSGNTDLLDKAKLEKRIASLESERKSFSKGRGDSEFRLRTITHDIANNEAVIAGMKADYARYEAVVRRDKDGNPVNNLTIDTCKLTDEKNMGIHLQNLAIRTNTHRQYQRIGEVYGFPVSIISEPTVVDGKESVQNRFVVEGNYKYKFNNGFIAMSDTHAACMNFVNALEKIPGIIAQYEERTAKLKADVPQLEAIIAKPWGKEDELKALKSELAALDRKITAALAPKHEEDDGVENKQQPDANRGEIRDNQSQSNDSKETMVAEPNPLYSNKSNSARIRLGGY